MQDDDKWDLRSAIKEALLHYEYWRVPGRISAAQLNRMADLPEDAEIPLERLGLPPEPT